MKIKPTISQYNQLEQGLAKILGSGAFTSIMVYLFVEYKAKSELPNIIKMIKDLGSENGVISLVGQPLFLELLKFEKTISDSAEEYAKLVGLPPDNITNIDELLLGLVNCLQVISNNNQN
jgi:hypothetical protein